MCVMVLRYVSETAKSVLLVLEHYGDEVSRLPEK